MKTKEEWLKEIEENCKIILDESFELCKHEDMGISLSGAEINEKAYLIKKIVEQIKGQLS